MKKLLGLLVVAALAVPAMSQTFWGSARGVGAVPPHQIHEFSLTTGVYTGASKDQVASAQTSPWGYRDGAADRAGNMYFGWETGLAKVSSDGVTHTQIATGVAPGGVSIWRAIGFDPRGDGGAGSLYVCNFASAMIEVRMNGALIRSIANPSAWSIYGIAYDDANDRLYAHSALGAILVLNKANGATITQYPSVLTGLVAQGGLSGLHDGSGNMVAVSQGTPDSAAVISGTGTLVAGMWDMEGQTGSNGHLGCAVAFRGPQIACGDMNCDGAFNGADIDPFFLALGNPAQYRTQFPNCNILNGDTNHDGVVNGADIDPFFVGLSQGRCPPAANPPTQRSNNELTWTELWSVEAPANDIAP